MNDVASAPAPRFRTARQRALVGVFRTADALRRTLTAVLAPYGLTTQQYNVLRILRGALPEPLPTMEIAERMMEQTPGITRLVDRLEAKGLVRRERCRGDRRQVLCSISDDGLRLLEDLDRPVDEADETAFAMLSDAQVRQLVRLLDRVREAG